MDAYARSATRVEYLEIWPSREEAVELRLLLIWALYGLAPSQAEGIDELEYAAQIHVLPRALPRLTRIIADYLANFRTKPLVFREREMSDVKALVYDYLECKHLAIVSYDPATHTCDPGFLDWAWFAYTEIKRTRAGLQFPRQELLRGLHVLMRDGARTHVRR